MNPNGRCVQYLETKAPPIPSGEAAAIKGNTRSIDSGLQFHALALRLVMSLIAVGCLHD